MKNGALTLSFCLMALDPWAACQNLILVDNSGSMSTPLAGGPSKAAVAAKALKDDLIPKLPEKAEAVLWAFGGGCSGFQFQGSMGEKSHVSQDVDQLQPPNGSTPLAKSIREALDHLKQYPLPRHLLVMTDGFDTCGGDPCAEVRNSDAKGSQITIHTIGLGMPASSAAYKVLECIADASFLGTAQQVDAGSPMGTVGERIRIAAARMGQQKEREGDLIVELLDSRGRPRNGVPFVGRSSDGKLEFRGETGQTLKLPPGEYQVHGGDSISGTAQVKAGMRATLKAASELGHLIVRGGCTDGLSYALTDGRGKTIRTGQVQGILELDLPPGPYQVELTSHPYYPPSHVDVLPNRDNSASFGDFGTLYVEGKDAAGDPVSLSLEIFNNQHPSGAAPIASGETNKDFRVPVGTYNVRVSPDDPRSALFIGGENLKVTRCQKTHGGLRLSSALLVCGQGPVSIWNNATGDFTAAAAGTAVALPLGVYNIELPDGTLIPNFEIEPGLNRVGCESR